MKHVYILHSGGGDEDVNGRNARDQTFHKCVAAQIGPGVSRTIHHLRRDGNTGTQPVTSVQNNRNFIGWAQPSSGNPPICESTPWALCCDRASAVHHADRIVFRYQRPEGATSGKAKVHSSGRRWRGIRRLHESDVLTLDGNKSARSVAATRTEIEYPVELLARLESLRKRG